MPQRDVEICRSRYDLSGHFTFCLRETGYGRGVDQGIGADQEIERVRSGARRTDCRSNREQSRPDQRRAKAPAQIGVTAAPLPDGRPALACRDLMQIAGHPATFNSRCNHGVNEQASNPNRSRVASGRWRECKSQPLGRVDGIDGRWRRRFCQLETSGQSSSGCGTALALSARRCSRLGLLTRNRIRRKPDCQASAITQGCIILSPVRDPVTLAGNVASAFRMKLERHDPLPT